MSDRAMLRLGGTLTSINVLLSCGLLIATGLSHDLYDINSSTKILSRKNPLRIRFTFICISLGNLKLRPSSFVFALFCRASSLTQKMQRSQA